jgi:hypothetical protein
MSSTLNPFKPGDRVVCIADSWKRSFCKHPDKYSAPKKGDVLTVDDVQDEDVCFEKHNAGIYINYFHHSGFAPVQDATDMEFEDTDTETTNAAAVEHLEEMTV